MKIEYLQTRFLVNDPVNVPARFGIVTAYTRTA